MNDNELLDRIMFDAFLDDAFRLIIREEYRNRAIQDFDDFLNLKSDLQTHLDRALEEVYFEMTGEEL